MKFAHLVSFAWPARVAVGTFEKPGTYPHFCSVHPKMGVALENSANITSRHSPHHRLKSVPLRLLTLASLFAA